jgi:hypothetical protein
MDLNNVMRINDLTYLQLHASFSNLKRRRFALTQQTGNILLS